MDLQQSIVQMELHLKNHYMINKYVVETRYSGKKGEYILLRLWMTQLREQESEFTKLIRRIRSAVPRQFPVTIRLQTEI